MSNIISADKGHIQARLRERIANLLPEIISRTLDSIGNPADPLDDNPLNMFVDVMALLHAPSVAVLDDLDTYFDVYKAPEAFVVFMASWFHLHNLWINPRHRFDPNQPPPFPTGNGHLRQLLAHIHSLTRQRGTSTGLRLFLEIATGIPGFAIEETVADDKGHVIAFHIRIVVPAAAREYAVLIENIIKAECPAHLTYEITRLE